MVAVSVTPTLSRRAFVAAVSALPLLAACAPAAGDGRAAPDRSAPVTVFLLVHGAWHGSAHWAPLTRELVARGHGALAIDLPGHGVRARLPQPYLAAGQPGLATAPSPIAGVTVDVAAAAVVDELRVLRNLPGRPRVVLVAHSMGGAVATRAAELAPELLDHLVYVSAFVPTRLQAAGAYLALPEAATATGAGLYLGDATVTGAVRINPRSTDPAYREELRATYYTDVATDAAAPYLDLLTPDQPFAFLTSAVGATAARWGSLPRTYVRCSRDQALPPALQEVMIRDADALAPLTAFEQVTLDTGHAPFASQPAALAAALDAVAAVPVR
jgi:pimeloyl-ACP methyl ester carboxylesterase